MNKPLSCVVMPMSGDPRRRIWKRAFGTYILPIRNPQIRILRHLSGKIVTTPSGKNLKGYWVDLQSFSGEQIEQAALVFAMQMRCEYDSVLNVFATVGLMVKGEHTIVVASEKPLFGIPA